MLGCWYKYRSASLKSSQLLSATLLSGGGKVCLWREEVQDKGGGWDGKEGRTRKERLEGSVKNSRRG